MLDHPGFKYFREVLTAQVATRTQGIILSPLESMDAVLQQEYAKGEAAGIGFAERFVDIRLATLREEIDEMLEKAEKPTEGRTEDHE